MQTSFLDESTDAATRWSFEVVRSWKTFTDYLEGARRLRVISYCDTPRMIAEIFEEFELEELELVAGNVKDYRERLTEEDVELVDRLEQLKRSGRLRIYTCPRKTVHSKMYLVDRPDGRATLITGSANLTRNSWTNHTNHLAVFETGRGSASYEAFLEDYEAQKTDYGEPFLEDLTDRIEAEEDREREEVIREWVAGRTTDRDEVQEVNMKLAEQVLEADGAGENSEIHLSLRGFDPDVQNQIKTDFQSLGGTAGPDSVQIGTGGFSTFLKRRFGVPGLWVADGSVYFVPPGGAKVELTRAIPDEGGPIDEVLDLFERYFETVEKYGQTNEPEAVKAHMWEAILYFLWAPFVNEQARLYRERQVPGLDKRLPFLYLQGESNSGKGTLLQFGLRLISGNAVTGPLDADEVGRRKIRGLRKAHSSFPLAVDDIDKTKLNGMEPLRNYWARWDGDSRYPTLIFTSNDRKPKKWFRNRAKILSLDVMFDPSPAGEAEVQRLIQRESPLFGWVATKLAERFRTGEIPMEADVLGPVRTAVLELYEAAGRSIPPYMSGQPAEVRYDPGRRQWRRLFEDGTFAVERRQDALYLVFDEDLRPWKIGEFRRDLPADVRATQEGRRIVVKSPDRFDEWLGEVTSGGWWARIRRKLGGSG